MANEVTFRIKIVTDGEEGVRTVTMDAEELGRVVQEVSEEQEKLNARLLDINQAQQAIQNVTQGLSQITQEVQKYTGAYALQEESERKLAQVMHNTMDATKAEVESIYQLCAAQQDLGVIGDEVQLSGAQELATYLEKKSTLETLIPVMNDMLAQQYGLNATQESAAQIATMLGKVMDGQTEALSRYGYSFTDAQKQILEFGTEEQRAAVLAEVVGQSVGGMNASLAQTDAGKAKQAANNIGDLKEQVGACLARVEPFLNGLNEIGMAANGILAITNGLRGLRTVLTAVRSAQVASTIATRLDSQAKAILSAMNVTTTVSTWALRAAMIALYATVTAGLFLAIQGLISLFEGLTSAADDAADAEARARAEADAMAQAQEAERSTLEQTKASLEINIAKLRDFNGSKEKEKQLVEEMNNTYGDTMGYFSSVADWYKALIANSEAYCRQMVLETKIRNLANMAASKELEAENLQKRIDSGELSTQREYEREEVSIQSYHMGLQGGSRPTSREIPGSSEVEKVTAQMQAARDAAAEYQEEMKKAADEVAKMDFSFKGSEVRPDLGGQGGAGGQNGRRNPEIIENARSYAELANNIQIWQKELEETDPSERMAIMNLSRHIAEAKQAQQAIRDLQSQYSAPAELSSLEDYDNEIARQENLLKRAGDSERSVIAQNIATLREKRDAMAEAAQPQPILQEITSYRQLDAAISYYQSSLKRADAAQRPIIAAQIAQLNELREQWQRIDEEANKPAGLEKLNTFRQLDDAIQYYTSLMQNQTAEELDATQRTITALREKRNILEGISNISAGRTELSELDGLGSQEIKVKLTAIGLDGIRDKIRELQQLLSNTNITDDQRKEIQRQIAAWGQYETRLRRSQATFKKTWDGIQNVGNGINSLTQAIKGNGNAWEIMSGVMNACIQIYEGINTVIKIVDALTVASTATQSTQAATQMATNSAEAATWSGLMAAKAAAAYAAIPFAGPALAAAAVAQNEALIIAAAIPKFADGAVAYGPTLGLFGEYANASRNPEVVAPLDRLRALLGVDGGSGEVDFRLRLRGRDLVAVGNKRNKLTRRS